MTTTGDVGSFDFPVTCDPPPPPPPVHKNVLVVDSPGQIKCKINKRSKNISHMGMSAQSNFYFGNVSLRKPYAERWLCLRDT